jgi:hypothetical protein
MNVPRASSIALRQKLLPWLLFAVLISPLFYYWIYCIWINPSPNYYTNDAEYPHFINSLAVFKEGGRYGFIDHPGTPVQVIGTVILGILYPFTKNAPDGFVAALLKEPGRFFSVAHAFLMGIHLIAVCFFFSMARSNDRWKNTFYAVTFSVLYFAIHPSSLSESTVWNHNSLNFPIGALLLVFLFKNLVQKQEETSIFTLSLLGLGAGIMTAITIYMGGWVISLLTAVFLYHLLRKTPWKRIILVVGLTGFSAVCGFFLAVLPIWSELEHFRNWIISLLTHKSAFLNVAEDQPRLERLYSNFIAFYKLLPILCISSVLLFFVSVVLFWLLRHRLAETPGLWAIIIGLAVQTIATLFMFLDRPLNTDYFLSVATILPFWTMAILQLIPPYQKVANLLGIGLVALVLLGMTITAVNSVGAKRDEVRMFHDSQKMVDAAIQSIAQKTGRPPEDITLMWMHGTSSQCWGLRIGDSKAYNIFTYEIERLCPQQYLLSNALRVGMLGNTYKLEDQSWDIIFGCEKNLRRIRDLQLPMHVEVHPELNWICGKPVVVTHE